MNTETGQFTIDSIYQDGKTSVRFDLTYIDELDEYAVMYRGHIPLSGNIRYKLINRVEDEYKCCVIEFATDNLQFQIDDPMWYSKIPQMQFDYKLLNHQTTYLEEQFHLPYESLADSLYIGTFSNLNPCNEISLTEISPSVHAVYQFNSLKGYRLKNTHINNYLSFNPRKLGEHYNHYYDQYAIKMGSHFILGGEQEYYLQNNL